MSREGKASGAGVTAPGQALLQQHRDDDDQPLGHRLGRAGEVVLDEHVGQDAEDQDPQHGADDRPAPTAEESAADAIDTTTKMKTAKTVQGSSVKISAAGGKVMIDDSTVAKTDIAASNGVIHVIDTVLMPK